MWIICDRLWIDADLEKCYAVQQDIAFEPGHLVGENGEIQSCFSVARIEARVARHDTARHSTLMLYTHI